MVMVQSHVSLLEGTLVPGKLQIAMEHDRLILDDLHVERGDFLGRC